jgi:hypothetical protein
MAGHRSRPRNADVLMRRGDIFPWPGGWAEWVFAVAMLVVVAVVIYVGATY